jgi:hypothetical protein
VEKIVNMSEAYYEECLTGPPADLTKG